MRIPEGHTPWIRYRDTGLYAVPSIHGRQVFAQAVHEACWRQRFEVIAVELPASFLRLDIILRIHSMAPAAGLIIIPNGETVSLSVPPLDDPEGPRELRVVERAVMVPVTPSDSIVTALRAPELLADRWPGWSPQIAFVDAEPPCAGKGSERHSGVGPGDLGDDYAVVQNGLDTFYGRIEPLIQDVRTLTDVNREQVMAARLRQLLNANHTILFVCGAAHLKNIFSQLDSDEDLLDVPAVQPRKPVAKFRAPVSVHLQPTLLWAAGFMDDAPALVWHWEKHCRSYREIRFDKRAKIEHFLTRAAIPAAPAPSIPIGRIVRWRKYLETLLATRARWTPRLEADLVHSAEACVGPAFAAHVRTMAMHYPANSGDDDSILLPMDDGTLLVGCKNHKLDGADAYYLIDLNLRWGQNKDGRSGTPLYIRNKCERLTQKERSELDHSSFVRVTAPTERVLAQKLAHHAREAAHSRLEGSSSFIRPFSGDQALGLDVRRSIKSFIRGGGWQVRHRKAGHAPSDQHCDGKCPIVWIFDANASICYQQSGYVPYDAPSGGIETIYSAFYWFNTRQDIGDTRVIRSTTAYALHLLREIAPYERDAYNRLITGFPEWRRCRTTPWNDRDLTAFHDSQLAVAAGIKYAPHHVVIVSANPDWRPTPAVTGYAAQRRIKLVILSTNEFDPAAIARYATDHEVPAPGSYKPPFAFSLKFVEPVNV